MKTKTEVNTNTELSEHVCGSNITVTEICLEGTAHTRCLVNRTQYTCCDGWTRSTYAKGCSIPLCANKTNPSACSLPFTEGFFLKYRNQSVQSDSGGTCVEPDTCKECNPGSYAVGAECRLCPTIERCNHWECDNETISRCVYCEGDVTGSPGGRAYTPSVDGGLSCSQACSWRPDSTLCYPGNCSEETSNSCVCHPGFNGSHCHIINVLPKIPYMQMTLTEKLDVVDVPADPNTEEDGSVTWTNMDHFTQANCSFRSEYTAEGPLPNRDRAYLQGFQHGITSGYVELQLIRDSREVGLPLLADCPLILESSPLSALDCQLTLDLMPWGLPFRHNDSLYHTVSAANGGRVIYKDLETNEMKFMSLEGKSHNRSQVLRFDFVPPYSECVAGDEQCGSVTAPLTAPHITNTTGFVFSWAGWSDDLSGLKTFAYELYLLKSLNNQSLSESDKPVEGLDDIAIQTTSMQVDLSEPGVYSVILTAFDVAGNHGSARRIILFDDQSRVDKVDGKKLHVRSTFSASGDLLFTTEQTGTVELEWTGRFENRRHHENRWLAAVDSNPSVDYDDNDGLRSTAPVNNNKGILRFKVLYSVSGANPGENQTYEPDIHTEKALLNLNVSDGEKVFLHVWAYDIFDEYADDHVTFYKDTTPPVITNLWLVNGDLTNMTVHTSQDLKEFRVEWEVYDKHSGLFALFWRIYDTYSGVEYGRGDLSPQAEEDCEMENNGSLADSPCYCTFLFQCFNKSFNLQPEMGAADTGGLYPDRDFGVHDGDYTIEITATNMAWLNTTAKYKFSIDTTPPQEGVVYDGIKGDNEVDFQQLLKISAHWEGFFDRESGVLFYRYGFSTECLTARDLSLNSTDGLVHQTTATFANHEVEDDGTYYITVVAFNTGYAMSIAVCSDGVVIDNGRPVIKEVIVRDVWVGERLIKDENGTVWLLQNDGFLILLQNISSNCSGKATVLEDIDIFPRSRKPNGDLRVLYDYNVCDETLPSVTSILRVLPTLSQIEISWSVAGSPSGVYDYEVGMSTANNPDPSLLGFTTTQHHTHFRVDRAYIPEDSIFYLLIKAISKSGVQSEVRTIGPLIMDSTPPTFTGEITLEHNGGFLVANWEKSSVHDTEHGSYPLSYSFAVGEHSGSTELVEYRPLSAGGGCTLSTPPSCTAVSTKELQWGAHGRHTYYVTLKIENAVGLLTTVSSSPFHRDQQQLSPGVVIDIDPEEIDERDFQISTTQLRARWFGFSHPYYNITYNVGIGTEPGKTDIEELKTVDGTSYVFENLNLETFKKYYFVVEASTEMGNGTMVTVSSDGVSVVVENSVLDGIQINDGQPCAESDNDKNFGHHEKDVPLQCSGDLDFQTSTNTLEAYWRVPEELVAFTPDVNWAIEMVDNTGVWNLHRDYEHVVGVSQVSTTADMLEAGQKYRFVVEFCAQHYCYAKFYSNGVTITPTPPQSRMVQVNYIHTSASNVQISATFEKFRDVDIEDETASASVMMGYEWALTDNSKNGKILTPWQTVDPNDILPADTNYRVSVTLARELELSKCWWFCLRGNTHAGLSTTISASIVDCNNLENATLTPRLVIDAVGQYVGGVFLAENDNWPTPDAEYTLNSGLLSAVWPTLRHHDYTWAVLKVEVESEPIYYKRLSELQLTYPCSHPLVLKCGQTDKEYVNVAFSPGELSHGKRYKVCLHAEEKIVHNEQWAEDLTLPEVSACSDGIVVDLTEPLPGEVWISSRRSVEYQTSLSDLSVTWNSFLDVEEAVYTLHASGISHYQVAIGTSPQGEDIQEFTDVGVVNHITIHGLELQKGHTYFATIKGYDFAGHTSLSVSQGVTVDDTPPVRSDQPIIVSGRHIISTNHVTACWKGVFDDPESGIDRYGWSIGSFPGYDDIMSTTITTSVCVDSGSDALTMADGHAYYISVRAYNGAGLSLTTSSWAIIVDTTPPVSGQVRDGDSEDIDFQANPTSLYVNWHGFEEVHSTVRDYFVSAGTCPYCDDTQSEQSVAITQEFVIRHLSLIAGVTYYVTVKCCNTANHCTVVSSDGVTVDQLPPTPGWVLDGASGHDIQYQGTNTWIGAEWFGFSDSQSGLKTYTIRVGTDPGGGDVLSPIVLNSTEQFFSRHLQGNPLPESQPVYVTVGVYNYAGLYTEAVSNGFTVDVTPPLILHQPALGNGVGSMVKNTLVHRTSLTVIWEVEDEESPIVQQYLSVAAYIGGDFEPLSSTVDGIARQMTLTGLDLQDGHTLVIKLTVCNAAKLCSNSTSDNILVDTSPPTQGMFAINTEHAAGLQREVAGWMRWDDTNLNISVVGFSDLHSDIAYFMVSVGRFFMGHDLNENDNSPQQIQKTDGPLSNEGLLYMLPVVTKLLRHEEHVFVSVWAVNKVGLSSPVIHSQFHLVAGGRLELVRRCSGATCLGHCVCAPQDEVCPLAPTEACNIITEDGEYSSVEVLDVTDLSFPAAAEDTDHISTDSAMAAVWRVVQEKGKSPLWYEWSIGYSKNQEPEGIFQHETKRNWFDIGQRTQMVASLPKDKHLTEGVLYSFFIRAWYDENTYGVFKSDGVYTDLNIIHTTNQHGSVIKELKRATGTTDTDFVMVTDTLFISWKNKFVTAGGVEKFKIYLSSYPGGYDSHVTETEVAGNETTYNFGTVAALQLSPGVRYYTNVVATSFAGIQQIETSDGFIIDTDEPVTGIVFHGTRPHGLKYQSSRRAVTAFWHGFTDLMSGIATYYWCEGYTVKPDECDVLPWQQIGLQTEINIELNFTLQNGILVYSKVFGVDNAGYESAVAISDSLTVDSTPPKVGSVHFDSQNILSNPSFEATESVNMDLVVSDNLCTSNAPSDWSISEAGCAVTMTSTKLLAQHGNNSLLLHGTITQTVNVTVGQVYRVMFSTTHLPLSTSVLATREGYIKWNDKKHVFLTYPRGVNVDMDYSYMKWHQHVYYFEAEEEEVSFSIGSIGGKGLALDDVLMTAMIDTENLDNLGCVLSHIVTVDTWSSIHAAWHFTDPESPITSYKWAIGYLEGGIQILNFQDVGLNRYAHLSGVDLIHDTHLHVTVVAINAVGLHSVSYCDPVHVDLSPPEFIFVHDGKSEVNDVDVQNHRVISVTWKVVDAESDIKLCEWAIGSNLTADDLQAFTAVDTDQSTVSTEIGEIGESTVIYVTVSCYNSVGLQSSRRTDGVRVVTSKPSAELAIVEVIPLSITQYPASPGYQSDSSNLRLKFSGFSHSIGVHSYKVRIHGPSVDITRYLPSFGEAEKITAFTGLALTQGSYDISISAINIVHIESDFITANATFIVTEVPQFKTNEKIQHIWNGAKKEILLTWENLFNSNFTLKYEICVGTEPGSANLKQWQETKETKLTITLPDNYNIGSDTLKLYVIVRAINSAGNFITYSAEIVSTFN
ncbi:hypothetical protein ScPMuIL_016396 [Solemya velum]